MREDAEFGPDGEPRKRKRVRLYDEDVPIELQRQHANTAENAPDANIDGAPLSKIQERFVWLYTKHYDPIRAAIEAGVSPSRAQRTSRMWLEADTVQFAIANIHTDRIRRMQINGDEFIARDLALAQADFTQVAKLHIPPCRYCWGVNNLYQRTHAEFEKDLEDYNQGLTNTREVPGRLGLKRTVVIDFDQKGGPGYNISEDPNPACPNCFGRGQFTTNCDGTVTGNVPIVLHKSLEHLPPELRAAVGGVKVTKNGVEIALRDRDGAMNRLYSLLRSSMELGPQQPGAATLSLRPDGKGGYGGQGPRAITAVRRTIIDPAPEPDDGDGVGAGHTDTESVRPAPATEKV